MKLQVRVRFPRIFLLIAGFLTALSARAAGNDQAMALGDAAYARKAYDSAISYYGMAAGTAAPDPVALFKLGNAHYRLKHFGEAVLAYERALQRRPGFAAAAKNVRIIQQQVDPRSHNEIFFVRWWDGMTAPELSNFWALLAAVIFCLIIGLLAWNKYRSQRSAWQRPQFVAPAIIVAAVCVLFSFAGAWKNRPDGAAVVMRADTKFRPLAGGVKANAISLPEGLIVKLRNKDTANPIVALPDGQEGLVQRFDIAVVE